MTGSAHLSPVSEPQTGFHRLIATARDPRNRGRTSSNGTEPIPSAPEHEASFAELLRLTDGFSARQLRGLVAVTLLTADDPSTLTLTDLIIQAQQLNAQQRHHDETGGSYGHRYQRWNDRGTPGLDR